MLLYFNGEWYIPDILWAELPLLTEGAVLEVQPGRSRSLGDEAPHTDLVGFPGITGWGLHRQYILYLGSEMISPLIAEGKINLYDIACMSSDCGIRLRGMD